MRSRERLIELFFAINGISAVVLLLGIFAFLAYEGLQAFREISITEFLSGKEWNPTAYGEPKWGILALVKGTLYVVIGALAIAIPLGIASAVYLAEVASPRIREILKPAIEMIAALPSVVLGLFGLVILAPFIASVFGIPNALNAFTASILVAVMALPTIISISEDVIISVPRDYREASLALGATKWQTVKGVVIPAASSGIVAAVMLGLGRAVGETMLVLMVAGNAIAYPESFLDPVRPLTANIAIEIKEVVQGGLHYQALFAMGMVLFIITFLVNLAADVLIRRQLEEHV